MHYLVMFILLQGGYYMCKSKYILCVYFKSTVIRNLLDCMVSCTMHLVYTCSCTWANKLTYPCNLV